MCDTNVFICQGGKEEMLMQEVTKVKRKEGKLYLSNLFGEERVLEAEIEEIDLLGHKILLREIS
jgi:predicted RNA-binding protein